jgi:FMN phosphatase YigB (HAD superfamily)
MSEIRMLRKGKTLYHWDEKLATKEGMVEVFMTKEQITNFNNPNYKPEEIKLYTTPDEKPGTGYVKNSAGTWTLSEKAKAKKDEEKVEAVPESVEEVAEEVTPAEKEVKKSKRSGKK